ncbi:hypothetical protein PGT21_035968 [Puccinia graminis f. sp. tritici]|uniref:Uncharacterized protein n=1 Tax=Puccinia graminis f. sp. tritici TaxID=56615 RepID=A0A5B0NEN5_PUCGR|nr:hypothetical protein PGT21_035968 [Puccinia graminis f. sp. tritici]
MSLAGRKFLIDLSDKISVSIAKIYENPLSSASIYDLGRSKLDQFVITSSRKREVDYTSLREALENDVQRPLKQCLEHVPVGFTDRARKELSDQIALLRNIVAKVVQEISVDVSKDFSRRADRVGRGNQAVPPFYNGHTETFEGSVHRVGRGGQAASDFYVGIEKALAILQNPKSINPLLPSISGRPSTRVELHHLNDILVKALIIFERHGLTSQKWLEELLNEKNGNQIIFNYLARRFPVFSFTTRGVPIAYLNSDLKLTLEESPFTEELRALTSCWQKLERLHLGIQLATFNVGFPTAALQAKFLELTGPAILETISREKMDEEIGLFMRDLIKQIDWLSLGIRSPDSRSILKFKLLHSMLHFTIKYLIKGSPNEKKILQDVLPLDSKLKEFDETIMLFSDVLRLVYFKYGESLQEIEPIYTLDRSLKDAVVKEMIFLADLNRRNLPSLFSLIEKDGISDVDFSGEAAGFIGIDHHGYRLGHLFKPNQKSDFLLPNDDRPIRIILNHHPQVAKFGPMIENILERLRVIKDDLPHNRLDKLKEILLHPEKFRNII